MSDSKEERNREFLLIDKEYDYKFTEKECCALHPLLKDFLESFEQNKDKPIDEWLLAKIQEELPDRSPNEVKQIVQDLVKAVETEEAQKAALAEAMAKGRSKESWFADTLKKATSGLSMQDTVVYLKSLDDQIKMGNDILWKTILTKSGEVNQNPNLDGYIAEQWHAQTFNMNAKARGSSYYAKVLTPEGTYNKNSVDVAIFDKNGKQVKRYQAKYYKDAQSTEKAFAEGDYRGQRKLVPSDQAGDINVKSTTVLESDDGTTSLPLSKSEAERMRDEARNGHWNPLDWNEYKVKDLAIGIGKQTANAALMGAALGTGFDIVQKLYKGEDIKAKEIGKAALEAGADSGVKAALAGALKVGAEKGILKIIPKGTSAGACANIAFVAVEDAKIIKQMADGTITTREGMDRLARTTVSSAAGFLLMGKGAMVGTELGLCLGPVGAMIGGLIGGTLAYTAGSQIGNYVLDHAKSFAIGLRQKMRKFYNMITRPEKETTLQKLGTIAVSSLVLSRLI